MASSSISKSVITDASPTTPLAKAPTPDFSALRELLSTKQTNIKKLLEELNPLVRHDIELPRIVTCGDQSSGKSSVLEAISRLDFPRAQKTCTKFATELSLSGTLNHGGSTVSTKIRWDNPSDGVESTPCPTTLENLASDINAALDDMTAHNAGQNCSFFKDVLLIEARHADFPDFTLIDLPGIIHSGRKEHDSETVRGIVESYIRQSRTIILAVVEAERDPEVQVILDLVKRYDPSGERTMGIITKPDRVEGSTLRDDWIRIANHGDPKYAFKHGWHVVRNRGPQDSEFSFAKRDQQEQDFFANSPWQQLGQDRLGIAALRSKLSQISEMHTREALPVIYRQLQEQHDVCTEKLKSLGPPRTRIEDQVHYLTKISMKFNRLADEAIRGVEYSQLYENEVNPRTFCSLLYEQYESFAQTLHQRGHTFEFKDTVLSSKHTTTLSLSGKRQPLPSPQVKTNAEMLEWIQDICSTQRGRELGLANFSHINTLFREQSKHWKEITEAYLDSVWEITQHMLISVAKSPVLGAETHTTDGIVVNIIQPEMVVRKERVRRKLDEISRPYTSNCAISVDPEFQKEYEALQRVNRDKEIPDIARYVLADLAPDDKQYEESMALLCNRLGTFQPEDPVHGSGPASLLNLMIIYYKV
jgi:GTPase SAR1 family protein